MAMNDTNDAVTETAGGIEEEPTPKMSMLNRLVNSRAFSYVFMLSVLLYMLVCGYVLIFSGSLFFEAISQGWYKAGATSYDSDSFMLGYLYGFASLLGVFGGLTTLSSRPGNLFRFKVLFFFPSVIWSILLVLDILRWGLDYWTQWLYLFPIMFLCLFVFIGVLKQAPLPYFMAETD